MTDFSFDVDEAFAKSNNEMLKDSRRLQLSAIVLGLILLTVGGLSYFLLAQGAIWGLVVGIICLSFALFSFILAAVVPSKVGSATQLYSSYPLAPAMIVEVNERDFVLMALVDTNAVQTDGAATKPRWGLALRTVTKINGIKKPVLGTRVPVVAVGGRRKVSSQEHWDEISPMPIAWGTPDQEVVNRARKAIPEAHWVKLDKARNRLNDVKATALNLLVL